MPKEIRPDSDWRPTRTVRCVIVDCGQPVEIVGQAVPPGWKETEHGLICPRHKRREIWEDVPPEEAHERALEMNRRR